MEMKNKQCKYDNNEISFFSKQNILRTTHIHIQYTEKRKKRIKLSEIHKMDPGVL